MVLSRIASLTNLLPFWHCDVLIIDAPIDLFYLTGLRLSNGRLFVEKNSAQLFVDGRYFAIAKVKSPLPVALLEPEAQTRYLSQIQAKKIAFDSTMTSYDQYVKNEKLFNKTLVPVVSPLKNLRVIKTEEECQKMRKSASLAQDGLRHLCTSLSPGETEKEVAWRFEQYCRERGAEKMAFDPIIAFGENTSFPHHRSSNRPFRQGDPVLIDVGCVVDSYASDVTRTLWSANVPQEFFRFYDIVREAHRAALALCFPGTSLAALDMAARKVMRDAGVEELFAHSLGHGIGLETHEFPRISLKADEHNVCLEEGMVLTIEPGLYAAGICGARHEDTIIIKKDGPENLYADLNPEVFTR